MTPQFIAVDVSILKDLKILQSPDLRPASSPLSLILGYTPPKIPIRIQHQQRPTNVNSENIKIKSKPGPQHNSTRLTAKMDQNWWFNTKIRYFDQLSGSTDIDSIKLHARIIPFPRLGTSGQTRLTNGKPSPHTFPGLFGASHYSRGSS